MRRLAVSVLVGWLAIALLADFVASDLPVAVRLEGQTYFLPFWTRPLALNGESQVTLRAKAEWMMGTLISFGPLQTVATTGTVRVGAPPFEPDGRHFLGTDDVGRDVMARLVHGARFTLAIAFSVVLLSSLLGVVLGALAGWKGRMWDVVVSRLLEVMSTFPTIFLLIVVVAGLRGPSMVAVIAILGLTRWPEVARIVRSEVLRLKSQDFVLASRAMGATDWWIIRTHLIPHALPPVIVSATFAVGTTVLLESTLSFLGLGIVPPAPSWGELLQQAQRSLVTPGAWWLAVFPGLAIASVVIATQSLGRVLEGTRRPSEER